MGKAYSNKGIDGVEEAFVSVCLSFCASLLELSCFHPPCWAFSSCY